MLKKLKDSYRKNNTSQRSRFWRLFTNIKKVRIILFCIACLLYINTIPNKWAVDDSIVVHGNRFVKRGIHGIDSLLSQETFYGFYGSNINAVEGNRWRPLSLTLFAIQAELFAPVKKDDAQNIERDNVGFKTRDLSENTVFPHLLHFTNMLLYGILCIVLYNVLLLLLNWQKETDQKNYFIAAIASLLFAVHPIHTEAVANIKGCDEILALLFSLLTVQCVIKSYRKRQDNTERAYSWNTALLSSFLFFMALLSKETAITFLAIIPLALWFFTACKIRQILIFTVPILLTFFLYLGLRRAVTGTQSKAVIEELMNDPFLVLDANAKYAPITEGSEFKKLLNPNVNTFIKMPFGNRLATNLYTYALYIKLQVWPYPLTCDYYPRHIAVKSLSNPIVLLSLILHVFMLLSALRQIKKKNIIAFAVLYYLIAFSIVSNLFFNIGTNMSERFMFMPSVGFCLAVACILYNLLERLQNKNKELQARNLLIASYILCIAGMTMTIIRNTNWKDNFTLFSHDIHVSANSAKLNMDLAAIYLSKAIEEETKEIKETEDFEIAGKQNALQEARLKRDSQIKSALPLLKRALEIHPLSGTTWMTLSKAFHFLGQTSSNDPKINYTYLKNAIAAYEQADYYKSFNMEKSMAEHRSLCYLDMGKLVGEKFGDIKEAIFYLEESKKLTPEEPEVYFLLGTAYSMQGNYEKALENTKKSLELRPDDPVTKENLAILYQQYAVADHTKKDLLITAGKLLMELDVVNKKMGDDDPHKTERVKRTQDLLLKNQKLQSDNSIGTYSLKN